jgi:hypothetical protein
MGAFAMNLGIVRKRYYFFSPIVPDDPNETVEIAHLLLEPADESLGQVTKASER